MKIDEFFVSGDMFDSNHINVLIVPEGVDPGSLEVVKSNNLQLKLKEKGDDLKPEDKRTALDSKKAYKELSEKGYYIFHSRTDVEVRIN